MKNNYKNFKNRLAIFCLVLSATFATAQTASDYTYNLRTLASTNYTAGAMNMTSDEITQEGTTFKIQVTVTPTSSNGSAFISSNGNNRWGVGDSDGTNTTSTIDGNHGDKAVISSLSIIDFNDNGTGYTVDAISNIHFYGIYIRGGSGTNDNPRVTVDGSNSGAFDLGQLANTQEFVVFGQEFSNLAGTAFTVGAAGEVTTITLENASTHYLNSFQIVGTTVGYTFTTDDSLSLDDITGDDEKVIISPSVVESTFSINKEFETLSVIDLTGKTVKIFGASDVLDVSSLNSGVYTALIATKTGKAFTRRFIVK